MPSREAEPCCGSTVSTTASLSVLYVAKVEMFVPARYPYWLAGVRRVDYRLLVYERQFRNTNATFPCMSARWAFSRLRCNEMCNPGRWTGHQNFRGNTKSAQTDDRNWWEANTMAYIENLFSLRINNFIICCGYKGYIIKEYFANYFLHMSDVTFDMRTIPPRSIKRTLSHGPLRWSTQGKIHDWRALSGSLRTCRAKTFFASLMAMDWRTLISRS